MSSEIFVACILAFYLHVPEPVSFQRTLLWPSDNCAQARMIGRAGFPQSWTVQYDQTCWNAKPRQRKFVVLHELCHGVYDYDHAGWHGLTGKQRAARHKRVNRCAAQILERLRSDDLPEGVTPACHPQNLRKQPLR